MVIAPALFLAGLGVHARTLVDDFEQPSNDPRTEERIMAYVPVLRDTHVVLNTDAKSTPGTLRKIAQEWIAGARSGKLQALPPIAYEDTSSEGLKSQVFDYKSKLVAHMLQLARKEAEAGKFELAAADTNTALQISEILKYSDFISMFNCASEQRRAIAHLIPNWNRIPGEDKEQLKLTLAGLTAKRETINRMTTRSRHLFLAWRQRRGYNTLSIEDSKLVEDIPATVRSGNLVAVRELRDRLVASKDDYIPGFVSAVRMGVSAQSMLDDDIAKLK